MVLELAELKLAIEGKILLSYNKFSYQIFTRYHAAITAYHPTIPCPR